MLIAKEITDQKKGDHSAKARWQWWIGGYTVLTLALIVWSRLDPGLRVPEIRGVPATWLAFIILIVAISGISIGSLFAKK